MNMGHQHGRHENPIKKKIIPDKPEPPTGRIVATLRAVPQAESAGPQTIYATERAAQNADAVRMQFTTELASQVT
jgi:hypothetical protein